MLYDFRMKVYYNLRMEKDLKDRLDAEAKAEGRSFNNLVNHILCEHVAERIVTDYRKNGMRKIGNAVIVPCERKEKEDGHTD